METELALLLENYLAALDGAGEVVPFAGGTLYYMPAGRART